MVFDPAQELVVARVTGVCSKSALPTMQIDMAAAVHTVTAALARQRGTRR